MTRQRAAQIWGVEAEWLAAVYLRCKGYRIRAKRFAAAGGEIDLIAERFGTLVFVEVKARGLMDAARMAITHNKVRRIERAARAYLGRLGRRPAIIRLDAVYLSAHALPRHEQAIAPLDL